jgi:hypothetical protein
MTLKLQLPPDLEQRLTEEADRSGMLADQYTLRLLETSLPPKGRRDQLIDVLQSWMDDDDAEEQRATGEYLIQALDEDRPSDRKLFPARLQGTSW